MFNDDIQGTAEVVLAGLLTAGRLTGTPLGAQQVLFVGAGVAVGAADLLTGALRRQGISEEEARRHSWFFDRDGLLVAARNGLPAYPLPYAHTHPPEPDLLAAIRALRPTALIGLSGQAGLFTERVLRAMGENNPRPIVFAMSNPTSCAECAAEEAYRATDGRVIYASGSPTGPLDWRGRQRVIGQANNAYIFPGVGLGVVAARLPRITDAMFLAAAEALAQAVLPVELDRGTIYPGIDRLREVSVLVAEAVVGAARRSCMASCPRRSSQRLCGSSSTSRAIRACSPGTPACWARTNPRANEAGRISRFAPLALPDRPAAYCTAFIMSKIGRYMAMTMPPTTTPRNTIITGSMRRGARTPPRPPLRRRSRRSSTASRPDHRSARRRRSSR